MTEAPEVNIETVKQWNAWLKKNHAKEKKVHIILHKRHTGKPTISHKDAMEEAICFGWIDTTIKRLDENKFIRTFARRSKNSRWSRATLSYAEKLVKEKRIKQAGLEAYKEGLKKPVIDRGIPKNPDTPKDLEKVLKKNKVYQFFSNLAPSYRRYHIVMVESAKLPETRKKRIQIVIDTCLQGRKQ